MAIKELFQDSRPQVLLDPRASQRIDPRFKFTRDGAASYYDSDGVLQVMAAPANQPRVGFNYEPDENGVMRPTGLLLEESSTNLVTYSEEFDNAAWSYTSSSGTKAIVANTETAPDGTNTADKLSVSSDISDCRMQRANLSEVAGVTYTASLFVKHISGGTTFNMWRVGDVLETFTATSKWQRFSITYTAAANTSSGELRFVQFPDNVASEIAVWGAQIEASYIPTSYIPTTSATATRAADLLSIEGTSLPSAGSIYIDARLLTSDVDDTLLSAANASDDKLTLAIREPADLYNSKALVYEVNGAFKPTLPFPVPTDARERNLITYGANNYHYRSDSSRLTPSSSSSVPTNMTRLGIGHDVTDPTKAITGYINTVYLWPDEITPTVAEALVRGDLDPQDADAGAFTPETGALAFVFNTQGTATDGDRVVELPLGGNTNNILVDWGDNTSSSFIGATADSTVSHTYPSAGIYPVQITADDDGANSGLENLNFFNSSQRLDLVRVLQWGGTTTWQPTTMYRAFRDCTQLDFENAARTNLPDTSAITDWREAFYNCSSLSGAYPNFNHSAATNLSSTWYNCSSITTFGSSLNDLAVATNYTSAWRGCSSITSFPAITLPTDQGDLQMGEAWMGCTNLESFPASIDMSAVVNINSAWRDCTSLGGTFPTLNTSNVTNFGEAWRNCSSLTSFPNIITSEGTDFFATWFNCSSLTSFLPINFTKATTLRDAFGNWTAFTGSFPAITTSSQLTNLSYAWNANKMTSFALPSNTSQVTNFEATWSGCTDLAGTFSGVFGALDTSSAENLFATWNQCSSLTGAFPLINTENVTNFSNTWKNCSNMSGTFPALNTANGTAFSETWNSAGISEMSLIDVNLGRTFFAAWADCGSLTTFPAGFFDSWSPSVVDNQCFYLTWNNCSSLTPASVVNILDSIAASGQSAPSGTGAGEKEITIDWDGTGDPATDAAAAITTLKSRNWDVVLNGVSQ